MNKILDDNNCDKLIFQETKDKSESYTDFATNLLILTHHFRATIDQLN